MPSHKCLSILVNIAVIVGTMFEIICYYTVTTYLLIHCGA